MTTNRVHRPSVSFPAELLPAARESEVDAALAALDALQTDAALDALLPAEGFTTLKPLTKHPDARARRTSWSPGAADVESENDDDVSWSDDAASLDEELREPARVDEVTHACLELLRGGRATRWRSACDAFLALRLRPVSASSLRSSYICARAPDDAQVTPRALRKAFRDLFAVELDEGESRALARALGGGDERVPYAVFAQVLDRGPLALSEPRGDPAPERAYNPVVPPLPFLAPLPGFTAAAVDASFRNNLLAAHESIAKSWLALRRLQHDTRRDLSYVAFLTGLHLYGFATVTSSEAEAVYAEYVGAPAALRREPLGFATFARRFADGGVLRPGLSASARAFRRAPVQ